VDQNATDGDDSTMFRDIWALSPGTYLELAGENASRRRYWTLTIDGRSRGQSAKNLVEQYRELLEDSVRLRLRSDVPVATMLSGGMDSTSITAIICEQRSALDNAQPGQIENETGLTGFHHTFTACWPGWPGDEEAQVTEFCKNLQLESHKVYLTSDAMSEAISKVTYHLDEAIREPNVDCAVSADGSGAEAWNQSGPQWPRKRRSTSGVFEIRAAIPRPIASIRPSRSILAELSLVREEISVYRPANIRTLHHGPEAACSSSACREERFGDRCVP
jgi:hypothetical protein